MKNIRVSIVLAALLFAAMPLAAADEKNAADSATQAQKLTADQIVAKANFTAYYQGADGRARVAMTIVDDQGRKRQREMSILRWDALDPKDTKTAKKDQDYTGKQKFYVYFHKPADVDKMSYLVWKNIGADDDRWLYLPGVDLVKRIAGSEKRTSFVGGDFFYEDISGRNPQLDKHELLETTKDYYVIKSMPKDAAGVEFASYKTWIHKATFLVVKQEYYDDKDQPLRRYDVLKVAQVDGYWTTLASRMTNLQEKRYTELQYSKVAYNVGVPEDVFTERYLRMAPYDYLNGD